MQNIKPKDIIVTLILIVINILLYVIPLIINHGMDSELMLRLGAQYWPLIIEGDWWRLFTCNFLHFTPQHLLSNMVALYAFGSILEPSFGHIRYTILYLLSGLGGSLLSFFINMKKMENVIAAGASTAIFGLMGAVTCIVFLGFGQKIGINISKKNFVVALFINLLAAVLGGGGIDIFGHLGGFITGGLVFIIMGTIELKRVRG